MKFKFVKEVEGEVNCYGVKMCATGDTVDLPKHLAEKAMLNPNYKEVKKAVKKAVKTS